MSTEVPSIKPSPQQVLSIFLLLLVLAQEASLSCCRRKTSVACTAQGEDTAIPDLLALIRLKPGHKVG